MFKFLLLFLVLAGGAVYYFVFRQNTRPQINSALKQYTSEYLIRSAQKIYQEDKYTGTDFSNGPCLTNKLVPDWVVDVAHSPRQDVDDQPENQCSAYISGEAHHFIELDPNGNLIRFN